MLHCLHLGTNSMNKHGTRQDRHCAVNCIRDSHLHFQVWGEKVNRLQLKCKKIIYLQKHQATCEFSHLIFHCTVTPEAVLSPKVCQAQIVWSSMCTPGLIVPCTHWRKLQGSTTQSQAQSRFSSSSAT